MLRLPHRILWSKTCIVRGRRIPMPEKFRNIVKKSTIISCDEVARMYMEGDKHWWNTDDFPNVAPIAHNTIFEYNYGNLVWTGDRFIERSNSDVRDCHRQEMWFVQAWDRRDDESFAVDLETKFIGKRSGPAEIPWRWICTSQMTCEYRGEPWAFQSFTTTLICDDGRIFFQSDRCDQWETEQIFRQHPEAVEPGGSPYGAGMHIPWLALSFMHCKNVGITDAADFNPPRKWLRRVKVPRLTYKTLVLHPLREVLRTEGGMTEPSWLKKALHICRGHFRHYGDDSRGLFGRYHGTFYVPQHLRGNEGFGKVVKNYEVKP